MTHRVVAAGVDDRHARSLLQPPVPIGFRRAPEGEA